MAGVPRMWTAAGEIKDSEAAAYTSGSERDSDDADEDGRKDDGECVVRAGPRQTGGGAAASPARQESVPAVVVFPRKRPMHGTEPGPEEGVIELSLESLRYGRRHARTACVRTDTRLAPRVPLVTRPCRRWSETECSLALTIFAGPYSRCGRRTRQRDWGLLPRRSSTCADSWVSGVGRGEAGGAKSLTAPGPLRH